MKKCILAISILLFPAMLWAQNGQIGLGVVAGDPTGITAKWYGSKMNVELVFGRSYIFYNSNYPATIFGNYKDPNVYYYDNVAVHTPVSVQLHFLKQMRIKELNGLSWYVGAGPQFRVGSYEYYYRYRYYYNPPTNDWYWVYATDKVSNYDIGVDLVGGIEYKFDDLPLSVFASLNLFLELADNPFALWGQGGVGIRYNFGSGESNNSSSNNKRKHSK